MDKILLVDGNSVLFRAFYASGYGKRMVTSFAVETNAVYTFATMLFKALENLQPTKVAVIFDSGLKSVRNEWYSEYKGTRKEIDPSLLTQIPITHEFLEAAGIFHYQKDGIEADDIIGTLSRSFPDDEVMILSSDKDLLQLIDDNITIYLMKSGMTELQAVNREELLELYGLKPSQIIDLKSLMGDASDNIPGVRGVGEKTALKLLSEYTDLKGVYQNLDKIGGSLHDKLMENKEMAELSYKLATIIIDCDISVKKEDLVYQISDTELFHFYQKYEMRSLAVKLDINSDQAFKDVKIVDQLPEICLIEPTYLSWDYDALWGYKTLYGLAINCKGENYYIEYDNLYKNERFVEFWKNDNQKIVFNAKDNRFLLMNFNIEPNNTDDLMIVSFLVDSQINSWDKLLSKHHYSLMEGHSALYGTANNPALADLNIRANHYSSRCQIMAEVWEDYQQRLIKAEMVDLYEKLERPLSDVLFTMEKQGVKVDVAVLKEIAKSTAIKLEELSQQITAYAFREFNINSPKQLSEVLFDDLGLKANKKRSTGQEELEKLELSHPIVPLILEYRKYQKLSANYAEGLQRFIADDGKIHTRYQQCLVSTGRLSSTAPKLQNISVRSEDTREIRKAFVPEYDYLMGADYSQIELRFLAHLAKENKMIEVFQRGEDIHGATAAAIYDLPIDQLSSAMRRNAKIVNFGIIYGMSDFGLANQLGISRVEASAFIANYLSRFPGIKSYMDEVIEFCQNNGYVTTIFGRRRMIPDINAKEYQVREFAKRAAMNAPIQGSAADLIKLVMLNIQRRLKKEGWQTKMIMSVHDELVFDVLAEELEGMLKLVKEEMEGAMDLLVPLAVDINYAKNWYGAK